MRITQEADYAVRIVDCLAKYKKRLDAGKISEITGVTLRFTLKILRKLGISGIVVSFKGVGGGYELARDPSDINLRQVIEAVDGEIAISKCLCEENSCKHTDHAENNYCNCYYHNIFAEVSKTIKDKFESINFGESH